MSDSRSWGAVVPKAGKCWRQINTSARLAVRYLL